MDELYTRSSALSLRVHEGLRAVVCGAVHFVPGGRRKPQRGCVRFRLQASAACTSTSFPQHWCAGHITGPLTRPIQLFQPFPHISTDC